MKRKPGRPALSLSGRTSIYVHAPIAEVEVWKRFAKRADMTLNGWLVSLARVAVDVRDTGDAVPRKIR